MADSIYHWTDSVVSVYKYFLELRVPSSATYRNTSEQRDEQRLLLHEEDGPGSMYCFQCPSLRCCEIFAGHFPLEKRHCLDRSFLSSDRHDGMTLTFILAMLSVRARSAISPSLRIFLACSKVSGLRSGSLQTIRSV